MSLDPSAQPVTQPGVEAVRADPGRARHYGQFYGLDPLPEPDRPLLVVHGNCQAESVRQLLQQAPDAPWASVRIPPVHELAADEVPLLQRLLQRASVVLTQPIADGYRGMPVGATQVRDLAPGARTVVWPVVFYAGLHPWQVVHHDAEFGDPPLVPYHDARTVLRAAGSQLPTRPDAAAHVSSWSIDELRRREQAAGAVPVSDLVLEAGAAAMRTVNHPANPVLVALARRLQEVLDLPATAVDPGRRLLDVLHAPVSADVLVVLGLDPAAARDDWLVSGEVVPATDVERAQLAWLAERPRLVADIISRHRAQFDLLAPAAGAAT